MAEPRDAFDLNFILQKESTDALLEQVAQKDPGFDLYWFATALNRAAGYPDEAERWPVKLLIPLTSKELKQAFQALAVQLMDRTTGKR